jgi:hypothetical protein
MLPKTMVQMLTAVPQIVGHLVDSAVGDGLFAIPGVEHRLDGLAELLPDVLGELLRPIARACRWPFVLGDDLFEHLW